jgi:hypothetical protein
MRQLLQQGRSWIQALEDTAMTPSCEVVSMPEKASLLSHQSTLFITSELLPLLASLFVKSASQLNQNIQGNALGYGLMLKGFSPAQIRTVVLELAEREPERFAPTPQELKKLCQQRWMDRAEQRTGKFVVSMAAIQMGVTVDVLAGRVADRDDAIRAEVKARIERVERDGGRVS